MGVGGVRGQSENGSWAGVGQGYRSDEGRFGDGKSGLHVWLSGEGLWVT